MVHNEAESYIRQFNLILVYIIKFTHNFHIFIYSERGPNLFTLPYRFPRGTVKVDRTAYRTFLTVFRDFYLKAQTLPRFKYTRFAV